MNITIDDDEINITISDVGIQGAEGPKGDGSNQWARIAVNDTNYTAHQDYYVIGITNLTAARTITLPDSIKTMIPPRAFMIKDESGKASTFPIRIQPESGLIDGEAYYEINIDFDKALVYPNGAAWFVT